MSTLEIYNNNNNAVQNEVGWINVSHQRHSCEERKLLSERSNISDYFTLRLKNHQREERFLIRVHSPFFFPQEMSTITSVWPPFKGPVFPALAYGGFLREGEFNYAPEDYIKSTGIILSFLVKNSLNETVLQSALKWEQR